jgi:hypothetical protein
MEAQPFQVSPRLAKNAPMSRFPFRGPPIPEPGNPEEDGCSIPTVCNLGPLLVNPSKVSCGAIRGSAADGVVVAAVVKVVVGRGAGEATGDTRLGDREAEGDERDDDEDLGADERDDLPLVRRTGRRDPSVVAGG